MDLKIAGRTALVCASTSGLGEAVARALGAEGANVVVTGRSEAAANAIAAELPSAIGFGADMMTEAGPDKIVDAARQAFGPIDILVLNGPGPKPSKALDVTSDDIDAAITTVLRPQQRMVSLAVEGMRQRRWGRILSIASTGVQEPLPSLAVSNIGRGALAGYIKTLATQVAPDGVNVNMLLAGSFRTPRRDAVEAAKAQRAGTSAEQIRRTEETEIPIRRYGDPSEFGSVAAFLCSDLASYVSGAAVRCDGGLVHSL